MHGVDSTVWFPFVSLGHFAWLSHIHDLSCVGMAGIQKVSNLKRGALMCFAYNPEGAGRYHALPARFCGNIGGNIGC